MIQGVSRDSVYGVVINASHYERAIILFWRPEMHTKLPQKPQTIEISKLFPIIIENDLAHFFSYRCTQDRRPRVGIANPRNAELSRRDGLLAAVPVCVLPSQRKEAAARILHVNC